MKTIEKKGLSIAILFVLFFEIVPTAKGVQIADGKLPTTDCIMWGAICLPFLAKGFLSVRMMLQQEHRAGMTLVMMTVFIFILSSFKIFPAAGNASCLLGIGLGTILFGPSAISIVGGGAVLVRAIMLTHGSFTMLGAIIFPAAIAGPLFTFGVFSLCNKLQINRKAGAFLSAMSGSLFACCVTSFELVLADPFRSGGMLSCFIRLLQELLPTRFPISILEGVLAIVVMLGFEMISATEQVRIEKSFKASAYPKHFH